MIIGIAQFVHTAYGKRKGATRSCDAASLLHVARPSLRVPSFVGPQAISHVADTATRRRSATVTLANATLEAELPFRPTVAGMFGMYVSELPAVTIEIQVKQGALLRWQVHDHISVYTSDPLSHSFSTWVVLVSSVPHYSSKTERTTDIQASP
jgi:hypothetical protein